MKSDELFDKLESLNKEELLDVAKKDIKILIDVINKCTTEVDLKLDDCISILKNAIKFATGVDGRVGKDEYDFVSSLLKYCNCDIQSLEEFRTFVGSCVEEKLDIKVSSFILEICKYAAEILNNDVSYNFIELIACIFLCNGALDSKEIENINILFKLLENGEDTKSNTTKNDVICEDDDEENNEDEPVKLIHYNQSLIKDGTVYYLSLGAEIKNFNLFKIAECVTIKIIVKNSTGRIIKTEEEEIEYIDSNSMFYFGTEIKIDSGIPSNFSINIYTERFIEGPKDSNFAGGISYSHYNIEKNSWGAYKFTANVHNNYNVKLSLSSYFIFYDNKDQIIGGIDYYVGSIYGNSDDEISKTFYAGKNCSKVRASSSFDFFDLVKK